MEIGNRKFEDPTEQLYELDKAQDERNQVILNFVEHLKTHRIFHINVVPPRNRLTLR